ncbi:MAG: type II secretion system major pseudopilin GspG [Verrucomicrobiota bacterium]
MKINRSHKSTSSNAFTLIEMVLVLAIIALLVGAGVFKLKGVLGTGKEQTTRMDVAALTSALRMYSIDNTFLPTSDQGLQALVSEPTSAPRPKRWKKQLDQVPLDPWGNPFQYKRPGVKNPDSFDVYSWGMDGVESSDDIGNWQD